MNSRMWKLSGLGLLAFSLTGCPNRNRVKQPEDMKPEEVQKPQPTSQEPDLRVGPEYKEVNDLKVIYFDLDQTSLRSDARDVLQKNYDALKGHPDWEALVEGHADERGTTEYNLGLGQKRAASVRQYYMSLGLPGTRVATISYGKENPTCSEHNEDCWSKNRRAVTKVRSIQGKNTSTSTGSGTTTGSGSNGTSGAGGAGNSTTSDMGGGAEPTVK